LVATAKILNPDERFGLLLSDGSILVLPLGTIAETAKKEAEEHDDAQVVRVIISIVEPDPC
jgi:hypothetical protein